MFVFTPTVTDNFTPNANPLNSANWTLFGAGFSPLQASSGACIGTSIGSDCDELYTRVSFTNDQYAQFTLNALGEGVAGSFVRASLAGSDGYALELVGPLGTGVDCSLSDNETEIFDTTITANAGDVFILAVIGTTLYVFQNNFQVPIITATDTQLSSGLPGLFCGPAFTLGDSSIGNFVAGTAAIVNTPCILFGARSPQIKVATPGGGTEALISDSLQVLQGASQISGMVAGCNVPSISLRDAQQNKIVNPA